jgi:uncharacterized damage-inducible protein DinB
MESWLDYHRATLLYKCQGLTGDQLARRAVGPSSLSLLGLVRHMAEVERAWFRRRFAGEAELGYLFCSEQHPDGDFDFADGAGAEADFAAFAAECVLAREAAAGRSLDDTFQHTQLGAMDLRWIYVHMIEEYARHNGHADILREQIDGVTGDLSRAGTDQQRRGSAGTRGRADPVLAEPGEQVMAAGAGKDAAGETAVVGDLGDASPRRLERACRLVGAELGLREDQAMQRRAEVVDAQRGSGVTGLGQHGGVKRGEQVVFRA